MSIDAVSSLRRRMIEDMNARKLCAGGTGDFHSSLWDFCNYQLFFCRSHNAGRVFLFLCRMGTTCRGPHDRFDINSDSAADLCRGWRSRALKIDISQIASG
jgi:hypothetical protein